MLLFSNDVTKLYTFVRQRILGEHPRHLRRPSAGRTYKYGIMLQIYVWILVVPVIDMATLKPVGEFGSSAWGEACAEGSIKILEAANLPGDLSWAFTEDYTHPPARLMEGGRIHAGYFIMVKSCKVSAGDGVPEECLSIPGFHVQMPWAAFCNQSGAKYGSASQRQRSADEQVLYAAIGEYLGRTDYFDLKGRDAKGAPSVMLSPAVWPSEIGRALGEGGEEGNGLHNIAATMQMPSPEFAELPVTEMLVPDFAKMTDEQKKSFIKLCGIKD